MGRNKKKPTNKLDTIKTIIEILAYIANIVLVVHTLLEG